MMPFIAIFTGWFILLLPAKNDRPELAVRLIPATLTVHAWSVVRESHTTYQIRSPREYIYRVKCAVTILDGRSQDDILVVYYDQYSKARVLSAAIYDQHGKLIRTLKKKDIVDISAYDGISLYTDARHLVARMSGGRPPYTIAYEYEIQYNGTMGYRQWLPQNFHTAIEQAELHIHHPQSLNILTHSKGEQMEHAQERTAAGFKQMWHLTHSPAVPYEQMAPPAIEIFPCVLLAPTQFEVAGNQGTMEDWEGFGSFIYDLNMGREQLSPEMRALVQSMITSAENDVDKVRILYDYLKENTRYVSVQLGIGGWQAYDAQYVEQNKYGDCKALSFFMKGMLKEADIASYPVIIGAGKPSFFLDDFVTPWYFNHMMLHIPDHDIWLECTSNTLPAGYIPGATADREVLLITPEGGRKLRTPESALNDAFVHTSDTLSLVVGIWHLNGQRIYYAAEHERFRNALMYVSPSDREKRFRESTPLSIMKIDHLKYEASPDAPVATIEYRASLTQYGSGTGDRMFVPANAMYRHTSPCTSGKRVSDIWRDTPFNEENTIRLTIPVGYHIETLPAATSLSDPRFGSYTFQISVNDASITLDRRLSLPAGRIDRDAYVDLCGFYDKITKADRANIVLKRG